LVINSGSNIKSADYCLNIAKATIEEAATKFQCKVQSFVSDNEKKMILMKKRLSELYSDEKFISYSCLTLFEFSWWRNFQNKKLKIRDLTTNILEVQKYFRNHHCLGAWLKNCKGSYKSQLPDETRWNCQLKCLFVIDD